jgi:hypothetical protein
VSGARVPFDPSLPAIVGCQDLACGPLKFKRGQPLPWRDLGVSELDLAVMYAANQVDFVPENMAMQTDQLEPNATTEASAPRARRSKR